MLQPGSIPFYWFTNVDFLFKFRYSTKNGDDDCRTPVDLTGWTVQLIVYNSATPTTIYNRSLSTGGSPQITFPDITHGLIQVLIPRSIIAALDPTTFLNANYQLILFPPSGSPDVPLLLSTVTLTVGPPLS